MLHHHSTGASRRDFLRAGAATVAGLASLSQVSAVAEATTGPARVSGGQGSLGRPNILLIMNDEQRFPAVYESAALAHFRETQLTTQRTLQQTGIEFLRHYVASVACVPSRASLLTGQYPSLHGASQTDGAAKGAADPEQFWLDPSTVPTLGDYFATAGYATYWLGKWHVSWADIIEPGTKTGLESFDVLGQRDTSREQLYQHAERLAGYGFSGWMGREPHGSDPRDSGGSAGIYKPTGQKASSRDAAFASQAVELLQHLDSSGSSEPWFMGVSFVNPHDIVLFGVLSQLASQNPNNPYTYDFNVGSSVPPFAELFDPRQFAATHSEDLSTKPRAQKSYRDAYAKFQQPILSDEYFRFYYQLHQLVDQQMGRVYAALQHSRFFDNTIVVFTSDHGDLLGAHGGMHQKWYTAYEEALHVPLIFAGPRLGSQPRTVDTITSHIDLLPTLLGLIGADAQAARETLSANHTEAQPLVGRDLSGLVLGRADPASVEAPIYFMTDDEPDRGLNERTIPGEPQAATVIEPSHIDTVITRLNGAIWKYTEYRDNTQFWSNPSQPSDVVTHPLRATPKAPGVYEEPYQVSVKTQPVPTEPRDVELYRLDTDPLELKNLALDPAYAATKSSMANLLAQQRTQKRLVPQTRNS